MLVSRITKSKKEITTDPLIETFANVLARGEEEEVLYKMDGVDLLRGTEILLCGCSLKEEKGTNSITKHYLLSYFQRLTFESWYANLEQTPLNRSRCQQLPAPYKQLIRGENETDGPQTDQFD